MIVYEFLVFDRNICNHIIVYQINYNYLYQISLLDSEYTVKQLN